MIINIIVTILIMSLLVIVHELGHFFAARKTGVRVEEFGLGIPPKIFGKKIGETEYSLNALPFGGFVKLSGEDMFDGDQKTLAAAEKDPRNFMSKNPIQRLFILSAGVLMNLLLAFAFYYVFFLFNNFKTLNIPLLFDYRFRFGNSHMINTVVTAFDKSSAAFEAGILPGEAILEVNKVPVYSVPDIRDQVADKVGQKVTLLLMDMKINNGKNNSKTSVFRTVEVVPKADENGKGILGVFLIKSVYLSYDGKWQRIVSPVLHSYNVLGYTVYTLSKLVNMSVATRSASPISESVAGPVGIYSVIGGILSIKGLQAFLEIIDFIALMSLSLAFLNILPFPALDGGRLFFVLIEIARGKKVSLKFESAIHKWGMLFLFGLIILVTIKDVFHLFG